MTEVYHFPAGVYPDTQRLTPDIPGQELQESAFNGAQSVVDFGGDRWRLNMTFGDLTGADRAYMTAFATKLRVSRNAFLVVNHTAPQRGALSGTPRVGASSLNGSTLVVGGIVGSVSSWALAGDFVSVNSELKMVLEDVGAVSGIASLSIWPPLRQVPVSGTLVVVNSPVGAFRLVRATEMHTDPPEYITNMTLEAVERVNSSMAVNL